MSRHHHARFLISPTYQTIDIASYCTNEELVEETWSQLGIDTVRALVNRAYHTPREAPSQLLVVRTGFITHEAQNALLKVLEEPPRTTHFLFVTPPTCRLLATVRSRVEVVTAALCHESAILSTFLRATPAVRLQEIDRRTKEKDRAWIEELQLSLLSWLAATPLTEPVTPALVRSIERLNGRGAMNKWLLEDIALHLPQDKSTSSDTLY